MNKEPALIIGTLVTIIVATLATLSGNGFISLALAGKLTDLVNGGAQLIILLIPLITAALIRTKVSPAVTGNG
jgi:hypothetical protein